MFLYEHPSGELIHLDKIKRIFCHSITGNAENWCVQGYDGEGMSYQFSNPTNMEDANIDMERLINFLKENNQLIVL